MNRSVFLDLGPPYPCEFRCIFCSQSFPRVKTKEFPLRPFFKLNKINSYLLNVYGQLKIDRLRIGGNEPLNYTGIAEVIRCAKASGYNNISLVTNGVKLINKRLAGSVIKAGINRFELPIYGHNKNIHDSITGVKGSFDNLLKVIKNLKCYPSSEVALHTVLLKQNYIFAFQLYDYVSNVLEIPNLEYIKLRQRNNNPKDYNNLCPSFTKIKYILETSKPMPMAKFEIPPCNLPDLYLKNLFLIDKHSKFYNFYFSFYEIAARISTKGIFLRDTKRHIKDLTKKPPKCIKCKLRAFCGGVPKLYLDLYGENELVPFDTIPSYIRKDCFPVEHDSMLS